MTTKSLPLLALVMLLPVAVLAFFAVRTLSLENDSLNLRRERLTKQRMDAAAAIVLTRLHSLGEELLSKTSGAYEARGAEALSALTRKRAFIYAAVFENGVPQHSATALEHRYDYARLLHDRAQSIAANLTASFTSGDELVPTGGEYSLLRCSNVGLGRVICVAVDSADVTRTMQSAIQLVTQSTGLTEVGLVEPRGNSVTSNPVSKLASDKLKVASQPMEGLLQGWELRGAEPLSNEGIPTNALLYLAASALTLGWLAMTWMLHRSSVLKDEDAAARAKIIAQLAHELRTPLANLKLHTDLLRRKSSDAGSVERYGAVLDGEIDRLANLAENAVAVARGGMSAPKFETAVADDCLRAILERFEPTLADARCNVRLTLGASKASRFDRTSWERCVVNLIDNARKYAAGSDIEIASSQHSDILRLEVRDHGPGIADGQRELIFEPLERGGATRASGFGLGLAAVRTLARQNGGNCWVERKNPGALFVLTLQSLPVERLAEESPC